jgi:hypothetical protein
LLVYQDQQQDCFNQRGKRGGGRGACLVLRKDETYIADSRELDEELLMYIKTVEENLTGHISLDPIGQEAIT